jgi:hypothetical protein
VVLAYGLRAPLQAALAGPGGAALPGAGGRRAGGSGRDVGPDLWQRVLELLHVRARRDAPPSCAAGSASRVARLCCDRRDSIRRWRLGRSWMPAACTWPQTLSVDRKVASVHSWRLGAGPGRARCMQQTLAKRV